MQQNEIAILSNFTRNEIFLRKAIPFFKADYFTSGSGKLIFSKINDFVQKYNTCPSLSSIRVELESAKMSDADHKELLHDLDSVSSYTDNSNLDWLLSISEDFCKDRALYLALAESIQIADKSNSKNTLSENAIPDILKKALAVSFDTNIGHDYIESMQDRFAYYHNKEEKIPFDIDKLNKITDGGIPKKTLNIVAAPTGGGKSLWLCHHAASCIKQNRNVLYITLEMGEERIAERIDANLMNIPLNQLRTMIEFEYSKRFAKATQGIKGKLIIKEYPTGTASVMNFRALLEELKLKKSFVPEVIIVDYINICASSRYKANANTNSYTMVKAIAEELRGLAVEQNVQVFSATQLNRSGYSNSDVDLTNTAESMGLPATADFFLALISTDELAQMNQVLFKQLKNRFNDINIDEKFVVGLDKPRMKFYNVSESAQEDIIKTKVEEYETETEYDEVETAPFVPSKNQKFDDWK